MLKQHIAPALEMFTPKLSKPRSSSFSS